MIRFNSVSKVYAKGVRPALDDVTVEIEREEFVFLVGKSGSGKSTFLQLVLREQRATSGEVWVLGNDVSHLSSWRVPQLRRQIGTVFQDFRLLPSKTVYENVALAMEVIGKPRHAIAAAVPDVLELVGLQGKEKRLPHELSGGEQQRVAIARALIQRPAVLLADEPTGNLDRNTGESIMSLLFELSYESGASLVVVTHDERIAGLCHRRLRLDGGKIVG